MQILLNHVLARALPGPVALMKGVRLPTLAGHQLLVNASEVSSAALPGTQVQITVEPRGGALGRAHVLAPPLLSGAFRIHTVDKVG